MAPIAMQDLDLYWDFLDMNLQHVAVRIDTAGVLHEDPTWAWDMDGFEGQQFLFWGITGGCGVLRAGSESYDLRRGDCFISPMADPHHGRQRPDALLDIPWLVFRYVVPETGQPMLPSPPPTRHRRLQRVEIVEYLAYRAIDAFRSARQHRWEADHLLKTILVEVMHQDAIPAPSSEHASQRRAIIELADAIRRTPGAAHPLESLARRVHYSPDHLVRLFKRHLGVSPGEFVIRCRMEEAQRLLLFGGDSIGAIADMLGYTDAGYFTRQFTSRIGTPPSSFRKRPAAL